MTITRIIGITILSIALWVTGVFGFWWMYSIGVPKMVLFSIGFGGMNIAIFLPVFLLQFMED